MSRASSEIAAHAAALVADIETVERAAFRRRLSPASEIELITMRRELAMSFFARLGL